MLKTKPYSNEILTAIALALLSALLFGVATPLSKLLLEGLSPFHLAGLLYLGAAIGCLPSAYLQRTPMALILRDTSNLLRLSGAVLFGGLLAPVLFLIGLGMADSTAVTLWLNLELVATALLGIFLFKERLALPSWVGIFAATSASIIISFQHGVSSHWAGVLIFGACACWALDNHLTAHIDSFSPSQYTFWKGLVAGSVNLLIGITLTPIKATEYDLVFSLIIGWLSYGVSIILYIRASHILGATKAQVIFSTSPIFGIVVALILLGEIFSLGYAFASILFLIAIILQFMGSHSHLHSHRAITHTHFHTHDDDHHHHDHTTVPTLGHVHEHAHDAVEHAHPHLSDIHHRHDH